MTLGGNKSKGIVIIFPEGSILDSAYRANVRSNWRNMNLGGNKIQRDCIYIFRRILLDSV